MITQTYYISDEIERVGVLIQTDTVILGWNTEEVNTLTMKRVPSKCTTQNLFLVSTKY